MFFLIWSPSKVKKKTTAVNGNVESLFVGTYRLFFCKNIIAYDISVLECIWCLEVVKVVFWNRTACIKA